MRQGKETSARLLRRRPTRPASEPESPRLARFHQTASFSSALINVTLVESRRPDFLPYTEKREAANGPSPPAVKHETLPWGFPAVEVDHLITKRRRPSGDAARRFEPA